MTFARVFLGVALLGAVSSSANAIAIHNGASQQTHIDYGNQFPSTMGLGTIGGSAFAAGSAVVIDDGHWVLTAAHILFNSSGSPKHDGVFIGTGQNMYTDPGQWYIADQRFSHPSYNGGWNGDIAVLYFKNPILEVEPAQRYRGTLALGQTISIVGYGHTGTPATGYDSASYGQRRGCENMVDNLDGTFWIPAHTIISDFHPPGSAGYNSLGGVGGPGDSGSGWYNSAGELVGITKGGIGLGQAGNGYGYSVAMDLTDFNTWIDQVQASIPEPATLILLSVGMLLVVPRKCHWG